MARPPRSIDLLTPTQFENLTFDLMVNLGMVNVSWRTPGADGGRDIEGYVTERDFSGHQLTRKWYVECKRYKASIDWPTIYGKIAFAESQSADALLVCTQSTISPAALTEVAAWNLKKGRPTVRLWPRHELALQLRSHPDMLLKYGLTNTELRTGPSFTALSLALSKAISSHYSRLEFTGATIDPMLCSAQSLAALLNQRLADLSTHGRVLPFFSQVPSPHSLIEIEGMLPNVDLYGLLALATLLAALTRKVVRIKAVSKTECAITAEAALDSIYERYATTIGAICTWAECELRVSGPTATMVQRQ